MPDEESTEGLLEYPEGSSQSVKDYIDGINALALGLCVSKIVCNLFFAATGIPFRYSTEGC